jgi:glutamyl-tRNA synthetase
MTVRVRFAPSPTGALHIGGARTVLFNYLYARKHGGRFVLRIEDTDRRRRVESSLETILEGLRWLGLNWDEGPDVGGPYFPYVQSERLSHYHAAVERLLAGGKAYRCFCTPERLEAMNTELARLKRPPMYDRTCLSLPEREVAARFSAGERNTVRQLIPPGRTVVHDLLRGDIEFDNATLDDQVLLKSDGYPTYHLAATVDDHLMEISHVIRADEWLPSFPKHVLLYQALGWEPPVFAHVPPVVGPDRKKLSKRRGAPPLVDFREMGYLPEAMVNFLAFLGWSPGTGEEIMSLEQLAAAFELEKVQVSPAVFDPDKLDSVNGQYIRALPAAEFVERLKPFVPYLSGALLEHAAPLIQTRLKRLDQARDLLAFLTAAPTELPRDLVPKNRGPLETARILQEARVKFEEGEVGPGLEGPLRELAATMGWKPSELFMTLRIALTGSKVTPPLLESAALLGRSACLSRIDWAIGHLARWEKAS